MYLYRAVDERGRTVESHLSRTRDIAAAKAFFRKALKRHGQPRTITLDGFEADALRPAAHGHAQRIQFPLGERGPGSLLSVLEQCGGAGSSTDKVTHSANARVQELLQCAPGLDRNRVHADAPQGPVRHHVYPSFGNLNAGATEPAAVWSRVSER